MALTTRFNSAGLSDPGKKRENNEDRFHADPERGIYFVIDGVGGQAAGEKAADTAHQILRARLERPTGTVPDRIREAITLANNEIHRLAAANDDWHGMACVLTVAVVEEQQVHSGQVGDSRLYVINPGEIRKLTHDHSPVGEREDRGEIDEVSAMRHPRRNEVYRDVGTLEHRPEDADFIEITTRTDLRRVVLLLCSDGLSDLVTSRQILSIVEAQAGNPQMAAKALVDAANEAGGKDNITVVLVEGPRFAPGVRRRLSSPRTTIPSGADSLESICLAVGIPALRSSPRSSPRLPSQNLTGSSLRHGNSHSDWAASGAASSGASPTRSAPDRGTPTPATPSWSPPAPTTNRSGSATESMSSARCPGRRSFAPTASQFRAKTSVPAASKASGFSRMTPSTSRSASSSSIPRSSVVDNEISGTVTAGIELTGKQPSVLRANS